MSSQQKITENYFLAESVILINSGDDYFNTLEKIIDSAEDIIHLQTYIFDEDKTGTSISEALIRAAKRGVKVFLLVDAYGSKSLSFEFKEKKELYIRADRNVAYGQVVDAMSAAKLAGVSKMAMLTKPAEVKKTH